MIAVALWYIAGTIVVVPAIILVGLLFRPLLKYEIIKLMLVLPGIGLASVVAMTVPCVLILDLVTIVRGIFGTTYSYEWEGTGLFTIGAVIAAANTLFFVAGFERGTPPIRHESIAHDAAEFIGDAADTVTDAFDSGDCGDSGDSGH